MPQKVGFGFAGCASKESISPGRHLSRFSTSNLINHKPTPGVRHSKNVFILSSRVGRVGRHLDLERSASQTFRMAHTYMLFDFGADEEKAQQARHKLEGWRQAFRLDKKLQFKFDRGEAPAPNPIEPAEPSKKAEIQKPKSKAGAKAPERSTASKSAAGGNGNVKLLVRLYFSGHEKLSEQRWLDRIPTEGLFKDASPKLIRENEAEFPDVVKQFDSLE
jgi:hypothetical protein